jgi:lipid-binding SYLF domain-containing protein
MNSLLPRRFGFVLLLAVLGLMTTAAQAKDTPDEERAKINKKSAEVLEDLYKLDPSAKVKVEKSVGYAVFSNVGVNLFVVAAAGGSGIVTEHTKTGNKVTYMKMGSAGVGIGLGVKDFRAVFVFSDAEKLKNFVDNGWDFSGEADAAAKSDDKGAAAATAGNVSSGVEVFQITKSGLALQATLNGTKYWKDSDLNPPAPEAKK